MAKKQTIFYAETQNALIAAMQALVVCDVEFAYELSSDPDEPGYRVRAYCQSSELLEIMSSELDTEYAGEIYWLQKI